MPDLVFMDIKMPEMDGVTATRKALEINQSIKIIALSMYVNPQYMMDMILAGAKGYILKDFETNELTIAVETVMDGRNYYSAKALEKFKQQDLASIANQYSYPDI